jgi:hypothetical protein
MMSRSHVGEKRNQEEMRTKKVYREAPRFN